jgi:hypothetical protein
MSLILHLRAADGAASDLTLPDAVVPQVIQFRDFASQSAGFYAQSSGLNAAGSDRVTYQLAPMSSTKASTATSGSTDPYYVMRFGNTSNSTIPTGLEISGFTVQATPQGHIYGGIQVAYSQGASVHDLVIKGIPGTSSSPPGETFSLSGWHANGMRVKNVKIDGRDQTGAAVAASLFATNSQDDVIFQRIVGQYSPHAFGLTLWQSSNVQVIDADLRFNRRAINCEQPRPGTMQFIRCDMRGQTDTANPHMTCSGTQGSTKYIVTDPIVDKWPLRVGVAPTYAGSPGTQLVSDVKLIVGGIDRTADPHYLMVGNVWGRTS